MKEEYFKNISFNEKKDFVKNSCLIYLKIKLNKKHFVRFNNGKKIKLKKFNGISMFENILNLMNKNQKLILKNEFLEKDYNSLWYLDYWCKSTYYKVKHETINKFLFLFFS